MADLTSTIRITGTVGGKVINYTHTMTVADVVDAGATHGSKAESIEAFDAPPGGGDLNFRPSGVQYILHQNTSTCVPSAVNIVDDVVAGVTFGLMPGQMVLIPSIASGSLNIGTTATTSTVAPAIQLNAANTAGNILAPVTDTLIATTAAS